jgi:hypothetical protein
LWRRTIFSAFVDGQSLNRAWYYSVREVILVEEEEEEEDWEAPEEEEWREEEE